MSLYVVAAFLSGISLHGTATIQGQTATTVTTTSTTSIIVMTKSGALDLLAAIVTIYSLFQILLKLLRFYSPWLTYEISPARVLKHGAPQNDTRTVAPFDSMVTVRLRNLGLRQTRRLTIKLQLRNANFTGDHEIYNPRNTDFSLAGPFSSIQTPNHADAREELQVLSKNSNLIAVFPKFPRWADITLKANTVMKDVMFPWEWPVPANVDVRSDEGRADEYTPAVKERIRIRYLELAFYTGLLLIVPLVHFTGLL